LLKELATEAEKQGSKDIMEQFHGVFIKFPTKKTQGMLNQHCGEERETKTDKDDIQVGPKSV
jgi:hypothetical protein